MLQGAIQTRAKVDYRITVALLTGKGKVVAASSVVEHVRDIEIGRVLTVMRIWKLDLGKWAAAEPVKSLHIRVLQVGAEPDASPAIR